VRIRSTPLLVQAWISLTVPVFALFAAFATITSLADAQYLQAVGLFIFFGGYAFIIWFMYHRVAFTMSYDEQANLLTWKGFLNGGSLSGSQIQAIKPLRRFRYRITVSGRPAIRFYLSRTPGDLAALLTRILESNPGISFYRYDVRFGFGSAQPS
jgi:hypothetical protein